MTCLTVTSLLRLWLPFSRAPNVVILRYGWGVYTCVFFFFIHTWYFQTHAWSLSLSGSGYVDYDAWCSSAPGRAPITLGRHQDSLEDCQHVWHRLKNTNNRVKILETSEKIRKIGEKPGIWRVIFDLLEEEYTSRAYLCKRIHSQNK